MLTGAQMSTNNTPAGGAWTNRNNTLFEIRSFNELFDTNRFCFGSYRDAIEAGKRVATRLGFQIRVHTSGISRKDGIIRKYIVCTRQGYHGNKSAPESVESATVDDPDHGGAPEGDVPVSHTPDAADAADTSAVATSPAKQRQRKMALVGMDGAMGAPRYAIMETGSKRCGCQWNAKLRGSKMEDGAGEIWMWEAPVNYHDHNHGMGDSEETPISSGNAGNSKQFYVELATLLAAHNMPNTAVSAFPGVDNDSIRGNYGPSMLMGSMTSAVPLQAGTAHTTMMTGGDSRFQQHQVYPLPQQQESLQQQPFSSYPHPHQQVFSSIQQQQQQFALTQQRHQQLYQANQQSHQTQQLPLHPQQLPLHSQQQYTGLNAPLQHSLKQYPSGAAHVGDFVKRTITPQPGHNDFRQQPMMMPGPQPNSSMDRLVAVAQMESERGSDGDAATADNFRKVALVPPTPAPGYVRIPGYTGIQSPQQYPPATDLKRDCPPVLQAFDPSNLPVYYPSQPCSLPSFAELTRTLDGK